MQGKGWQQGAASFAYAVERKDRTIYFSSLRNGEKENFFEILGRKADESFGKFSAFFTRENVIVQQPAVHLLDDGFSDLGHAMTTVGYEDATAPIQPLVAVSVIDINIFGAVPNQRRLPAHGLRFRLAQTF